MQKFEFKPALLAAKQTYRLKADVLSRGGGGQDFEVPLSRVERAGLVDQNVKGQRMTRLDLYVDGNRYSVSLNQAVLGWRRNPDVVEFLALLRALSPGLEAQSPRLEVTLGEYGRFRLWLFGAGIFSALTGIGLFLFAVAAGASHNALISAIIPVLILVVFGLFTSRAYWPWTKLPRVPIGEFPKVLAFLEGDDAQ